MRAMILYEHCSPHQVTAVETARQHFAQQQCQLFPVEFYYGLKDYSWTLKDKHRPDQWACFFPTVKSASNFELFRRVFSEVKEKQIDVLVVNGWYGRFVWWLAAIHRWLPCKLVVVSDSIGQASPQPSWKVWPKRWLISRMHGGFVAGTRSRGYLHSLGMPMDRIALGADVVDNSLYSSIPLRSLPLERKVIIGTVARFIPEKNLAVAIPAFAQWSKSHPEYDVEWHLAGSGPLEADLQQLAQESGSRIVFPGFVSYHDIPAFYSTIDLYWQPSISDTWGLVINEAMAAGLPVLVSQRCGCAVDLVQSGNGWIHDVHEPQLVEALETAWQARSLWPTMGQAGRELVSDWGCERFADGLYHVCRQSLTR